MFSGSIEEEHWPEMGKIITEVVANLSKYLRQCIQEWTK